MRQLMFVAIAVVGLAGCGESSSEATAEAMASQVLGQDVELEDDGETVTIGGVRMSSGDAAKLPADFPQDVFLPDSYRLESVIESAESTSLHMSTGAAVDQLFADAAEAMKGHGWTQGWTVPPQDGVGLMSFEKAERRASISVDDRGDEDTFFIIETGAKRN